MDIINKTIELEKDFANAKACITQARKELRNYLPEPGFTHYLYYKAPRNNDLIIVNFKNDKWNVREADDKEWTKYFNEFIYNKTKIL